MKEKGQLDQVKDNMGSCHSSLSSSLSTVFYSPNIYRSLKQKQSSIRNGAISNFLIILLPK